MKYYSFLFLATFFCGFDAEVFSQTVSLQYEKTSPQAAYAASKLEVILKKRGYSIKDSNDTYTITFSTKSGEVASEGYSISNKGNAITIKGGDDRGLIYGTLSIVEDLRNGMPLQKIKDKTETPAYPFRAIKFDLPWDTYRHSVALDLHYETCRDVKYWESFLDMMVENRFNSLTLWNLHPFTFMIKSDKFPEASPYNDREMLEWKTLFRTIFKMAHERAIDTYLFPFNIFVSPEFAKAHNVAMDNLGHHFFVKGDTSAIIKEYTRECVRQVLQEYPTLTGMGITHGEGMGGMTPKEREIWISETIIEGMRLANRKSKLVHRIPLSANVGSGGSTSIETERLTREVIEAQGALPFIESPIWADLKYNWSHAHSTPKLVKVHGGKLYDTYFKPEPKNYKVTWTARNEDFFCLRWGVPDFVRAHLAQSSQSYVGGYFVGSETYIPAVDYFTNSTSPVPWTYAFERQWLFYKIWGRLLYNPATPNEVFNSEFITRYGKEGGNLLEAHALAGTTPLYLASSFDFTWDFTLYSEGFLALDRQTGNVDYISVDRQINQPPTDPDFISIKDYVKALNSGKSFEPGKTTPPMLADMLESNCKKALALVASIRVGDNAPIRHEVADIKTWANLGLYFAEKIRGGVALQTFRTKGEAANQSKAVSHLKSALQYWDVVVSITRPIYRDMPLVHFSEQKGSTPEKINAMRFHWEKVRPAVANDVEVAMKAIAFSVE